MNHTPMMMPMALSSPVPREKFDSRIMFTLQPSLEKRLDSYVAAQNSNRSEAIREALEKLFDGSSNIDSEAPQTFTAPYLGAIPCGPWDSSQQADERFTVSTGTADELGARDGDWWFRARGESMTGAGIIDSSVVLVRPYEGRPARRGDIVAVQITGQDGETIGTFKRFDGYDGDSPRFLNGDDEPFDLPESVEKIDILARGVGVVSRL